MWLVSKLVSSTSHFRCFAGDSNFARPQNGTSIQTRSIQQQLAGMFLLKRHLLFLLIFLMRNSSRSQSFQTFGHTLRSSMTELSMLSMFLVTGIIFFSTVMYYLEKDEPFSDFYSIPAGCWWCVSVILTLIHSKSIKDTYTHWVYEYSYFPLWKWE